jgi:16S rRNA processing protein RimM
VPEEPVSGTDWLLVARVVRPRGRRGEIIADILTDFPERFQQRSRLVLLSPEGMSSRPRDVELENFWFHQGRIVLKFRGIESINEAEELRGCEVAIPVAVRAPLQAGEVYISDLVGCRLIDLNTGAAGVGDVVDVDRESSNTELLIVRRAEMQQSEDLLIPWVKEYLVSVDLEKGQIRMRLPGGLLEINAPLTEEEKKQIQRPAKKQRESSEEPANEQRLRGDGGRGSRKKRKSRAGIR